MPTVTQQLVSAAWQVGWLAGWLVGWLAGWLVGCLAGWMAGCILDRIMQRTDFKFDSTQIRLRYLPMSAAERSLASFNGDADALVADFFTAWSRDLPEPLAAINSAICSEMLMTGRTRFATWFKLPASQADQLVKAGHGKDDATWAAGWRLAIEDLCGFKFAPSGSSVPESAALVRYQGVLKSDPTSEPTKPQTVGGRLMASGQFMDERLPSRCFAVVETPNPKLNPITNPETEAVTDEICEYIAATKGCWKMGKPLAKHYGKQAEAELPHLPDYGDDRPGKDRKWWKMIYDKCRNRYYVPCIALHAVLCPVRLTHDLCIPSRLTEV